MRRRTLLSLSGAALPAPLIAREARAAGRRRWLHTWTATPQQAEPGTLPPAPFTGGGTALADTTLRQTVRASVGGLRLRVRFSNAFGTAPLPITAAAVALPLAGRAGVAAVEPRSTRPLTFGGRPSATVPPGAQVVSDPVDLPVAPRANLTITAYLATGRPATALTAHPGSRTTSYLTRGDHHADEDLPGAVPVDHWYLISGVEVFSRAAGALVIVGDSLTDGRGSTTNGNDRWPDQLQPRLPAGVAVLNQAAGGNRILTDGLGPSVLARFDRDVLSIGRARWLLLFEGVNDIGTAAATEAAQSRLTADLKTAFTQLVTRARARDLTVFGATLTPFGGNGYDDPAGTRERSRHHLNTWIRTSGVFDEVLDFDRAVRDAATPTTLSAPYDTGDHLHLTPAGYQALAAAVPPALFTT